MATNNAKAIAAIQSIAEDVKSERARRGLSYREVEAESGVNYQTVRTLELGTYPPSYATLIALLGWLDESTRVKVSKTKVAAAA